MPLTLPALNAMAQADFTHALGATYEHTPAIAAAAWHHRPFATLADLHRTMVTVVKAMAPEQQLALICAHPDLGNRMAMADASIAEQTSAGLHQLTAAEYQQFQTLNTAYRQRFGFPFILAVTGHSPASILQIFQQRLHNSAAAERSQALAEIHKIALIRLQSWVYS